MLSLELSVGTTGLWLGLLLVSFKAAITSLLGQGVKEREVAIHLHFHSELD